MGERGIKRGMIFSFAICSIILVFVSLIFLLNTISFISSASSNVTEDLGVGWIRNNPIYDLEYDSSRGLVYIGGGGGSFESLFGLYDKSTGVLENLGETEAGGTLNSTGDEVYALTFDSRRNLTYISGLNNFLGVYNRTLNITTNLTVVGGWVGAYELLYIPNGDLIYWVGGSGQFGVYNVTNNTNENLNNTDTGDWLSGVQILALTYDNDTNLTYLGGNNGKFGVYNRTLNVATDLSGTDTGDWIGATGVIQNLAYDSRNKSVYIGGGSSSVKTLFGVYTRTSNTAENLNATDPGNWIPDSSSYTIYSLVYNPTNGLVYLSGGGAGSVNIFGAYNRSTNITYDLRSSDLGDWMDGDTIRASVYDPSENLVYLGSEYGRFGAYNATANTSENLKDPEDWISGSVIKGVVCDSNNSLIYFVGEGGTFGAYNRTANHREDLRLTDTGDWLAYAYLYATTYDSDHNLVYLTSGNGNGMFGFYNRTSNITNNLTATDPGDWLGSTDLHSLTYDSSRDLVYLGGTYGKFGIYNLTSNITYDLRMSDTGDWIGSAAGNYIQSMAYDNDTNLIYLAGNNAIFGVYNRSSNVTTDLRGTDPGNWMGSSGSSGLYALTYDSKNKLVYVAGLEYSAGNNGIFGVYNRTSNVATDLSSTDTGGWIASPNYINALAYDSSRDLVYAVGTQGVFGVYNRTANVMEDLRGTDTDNWIRTDSLNSVTYDSVTGLVYIAGNNGLFGVYNRSSNTTTIAEQVISVEETVGGTQPAKTTTASVPSIPAGEPTTVTITNPNIEVGSITITTTENVSSVSVTVTEVPRARVADFEIGISTRVIYQALNITARGLNNSQIESASINFRVNMSWVEQQRRATEEDILLFRRNDTTRRWEALNTTYLYNDSQFYYYTAITPGFSTFVIYFGRYECEPGINRCFESQTQLCLGNATWLVTEKCAYGCNEQGECLETPLQSKTFYTFLIVAVGVVAVIVLYFLTTMIFGKKRRRR